MKSKRSELSLRAAPGAELLPYQKRWANDKSRWKFGLMARQVGKDFASGFEGIRDCVEAELAGRKVDWLIAAPSERQSLESLQKWKDWAESFKLAFENEELTREGGSEGLMKSAAITFSHGSRAIAVPGRPETVRGFSANVLMTEFAFFEQPDLTWRAILPSITNPLKGGVKKVRLITTPNGVGNKAHEIWTKNFRVEGKETEGGEIKSAAPVQHNSAWSCHFVPIDRAVEEGLPVNIEELREALDDPEGWAQEFECQFLDTQSVLLPYELIATCESLEATTTLSPEFWQATPPFPLVMGIDFGRRRDLTVAWSLAQLGDVQQTMEVLELDRMSTPAQVELLRPRIRKARRVCLDYTGPGIGLGDYLVKEFGEWNPSQHKFGRIELCVFSNALKVEVMSKLRVAFEKRALRVPVSRAIREDLHSMSRVASPSGQITYRAPHTPDGHADRCTALALGVRAGADSVAVPLRMERVVVRPGVGDMGMGRVTNEVWM
ncbi:MAG TPA: terminase family protein [Verrucomicrobiae bacterium]|jgi:phage FluMu gp28-like protein|nr:terminase family protein [Verrucomicrobiae bacterium]